MDNSKTLDTSVLILGSGPAGYTAAIYAARANLKPILLTGMDLGGQVAKTHEIANWPGEPGGIAGYVLMDKMHLQAQELGVHIQSDTINKCDLSKIPYVLEGDLHTYRCKTLIIATGAKPRYLGLPAEKTFEGRGVSYCAVCDGAFYRNKPVAVVGGGNTAVTQALYLANIASHVVLIHRRDQFRAEKILLDRLNEAVKSGTIELAQSYVVEDIIGDDKGVTGIQTKSVQTEQRRQYDVAGVFIAIGHIPNTALFEGQLTMNDGYIVTEHGSQGYATATSLQGVFAAGDVQDSVYQQAITSAATGCMAALDAERFLVEQDIIL